MTPEKYSKEELILMKQMFQSDKAYKLIRKIIFPNYDFNADVNGNDIILKYVNGENTDEAIAARVRALKILHNLIEDSLSTVQILVNKEDKDEEKIKENIEKNSTK